MNQILSILTSLVDADHLGGWVRAGTAALLGAAAGWFGGKLAPFLTPEFQTAIGVVLSTVAVGVWSSIAKKVTPALPGK